LKRTLLFLMMATGAGDFAGYPMDPRFFEFMGGIRFTHYLPDFAKAMVKIEDPSRPLARGLPPSFVIDRDGLFESPDFVPLFRNAIFWAAAQTPLRTQAATSHYVFFGRDRDRLPGHAFLDNRSFEGAQVMYSWKQLEPVEDQYEFAEIDADIAILKARHKKLWIQLQDATFSPDRQAVPRYIVTRPQYGGGAHPQYDDDGKVEGWVARRWDPAVQARLHKLFGKLAERYDGVIAGINLQESSIGISEEGVAKAPGFTYVGYRDAIKRNMHALRDAFKTSVVMQYVNFMPGEALPELDRGLIRSLYDYGEEIGVAVGAPDLLPLRPFQQAHAYRFMREKKDAGRLTVGIAVQDGNYRGTTGVAQGGEMRRAWPDLVPELAAYAHDDLGARYVFWSIEEPYFSKNVMPFFSKRP
jgi:hypothetical protein